MTKRLLWTCALATALAAIGTGAASAQTLTATLMGNEETPAALNTGAFGSAEVGVDAANREITVNLQIFNLPTGSAAGHIHAGARGTAGPVVIDFLFPTGRTGDFTLNLRLGQANFRARPEIGINTIDDAIQAILGGNAYVNVHTTQYPGGEIRGQLTRRGRAEGQ
jgi:hypothetical protein